MDFCLTAVHKLTIKDYESTLCVKLSKLKREPDKFCVCIWCCCQWADVKMTKKNPQFLIHTHSLHATTLFAARPRQMSQQQRSIHKNVCDAKQLQFYSRMWSMTGRLVDVSRPSASNVEEYTSYVRVSRSLYTLTHNRFFRFWINCMASIWRSHKYVFVLRVRVSDECKLFQQITKYLAMFYLHFNENKSRIERNDHLFNTEHSYYDLGVVNVRAECRKKFPEADDVCGFAVNVMRGKKWKTRERTVSGVNRRQCYYSSFWQLTWRCVRAVRTMCRWQLISSSSIRIRRH